MKKVVHVLNHFLPHQTAGTEVYTWALIKALEPLGISAVVLIPNYGNAQSDQYEHDGITVYRYAETSIVDRTLIMGKRTPDGLPHFQQLLRQIQPDIVHFHELAGSNGITLAHIAAAKKLGYRIVMTFHLAGYTCKTGSLMFKNQSLCDGKIEVATCSSCYWHQKVTKHTFANRMLLQLSILLQRIGVDTTQWNNRLGTALGTASLIVEQRKRFLQLAYLCDSMVSLTEWYRTILIQNGAPIEKVVLIKQGLPSEQRLTIAPKEAIQHQDCLKLLFVGRVSAFKGLHILLQALMSLPKDSVSLSIYGQIQEKDYAQYWQEQTYQYSNINWCGPLLPEKVVTTMQEYDALCLCSTFSEMSPLVIQEAFAARLPVIASNVYGNAEQIKHGENGWLFRFNDSVDLANILESIIKQPLLLKAAQNKIKAPTPFSMIAQQYIEQYNKVSL